MLLISFSPFTCATAVLVGLLAPWLMLSTVFLLCIAVFWIILALA